MNSPYTYTSVSPNIAAFKRLLVLLNKPMPKVNRKSVKFNLFTWMTANCETTACAVGSCMLDPWFITRGLGCTFWSEGSSLKGRSHMQPTYKNETNWTAVQAFFGVSDRDACHLFKHAEGYETRAHVAKRVREFLRQYDK